jgi:hypothetical protein
VERQYTDIACNTSQKIYIRKLKNMKRKKDNLRHNFRRRLANKKKPRRFIERWRILRKSNKKAYDFLKKNGRRLKNDDKRRPNFTS